MNMYAFYLEESGCLMGQYVVFRNVKNLCEFEHKSMLAHMTSLGLKDAQIGSEKDYNRKALEAISRLYRVGEPREIGRDEFESYFTTFSLKEVRAKGLVVSFRDAEGLCLGLYNYFVKLHNRYFCILSKSGTKQDDLVAMCKTVLNDNLTNLVS